MFFSSEPLTSAPTSSGEDQGPIGIGTSSPLIGPEPASVTTQSILRSGHLPTPQLGIISDIERAIKGLARTQAMKEKICEYIQAEVSLYIYELFPFGIVSCTCVALIHMCATHPDSFVLNSNVGMYRKLIRHAAMFARITSSK